MQRFSISIDDDLAAWIESKAEDRGVSKAKVIRDAVETAKFIGLVHTGDNDALEPVPLVERIEEIEDRLDALEHGSDPYSGTTADDSDDTDADVVATFRAQLEGRPPTTEHGENAVVRVFKLLIEDGPLQTKELRETIYPEFEAEFTDAHSMWQSTQRYFDDLPGIEKVGHGEWDADPESLSDD